MWSVVEQQPYKGIPILYSMRWNKYVRTADLHQAHRVWFETLQELRADIDKELKDKE